MTRSLAWGTALIIVLGAAVLAGGSSRQSPPATPNDPPRDAALARCQTLGEAAGQDPACRRAWAAARARFFGGDAS